MELTEFERVQAMEPKELNLGSFAAARPVLIGSKLSQPLRKELVALLHLFGDVFVWTHTDLPGLDVRLYQHRLHLKSDTKLVEQRCYRMNPNYVERVWLS